MRLKNLLKGDIQFQIKYGFYFLYIILSILYLCIILALPDSYKKNVATILIFSDPAAMGLFFMGAIILLEKSQRVLNSLAVSPVTPREYILSKVLSLALISTIVGGVLITVSNSKNIVISLLGVFLASVMFSLLGLIVATKIESINQFLVLTVPVELLFFVPPIVYLFGFQHSLMLFHPGVVLLKMISGDNTNILVFVVMILIWIAVLYIIAHRLISNMIKSVGGIKL